MPRSAHFWSSLCRWRLVTSAATFAERARRDEHHRGDAGCVPEAHLEAVAEVRRRRRVAASARAQLRQSLPRRRHYVGVRAFDEGRRAELRLGRRHGLLDLLRPAPCRSEPTCCRAPRAASPRCRGDLVVAAHLPGRRQHEIDRGAPRVASLSRSPTQSGATSSTTSSPTATSTSNTVSKRGAFAERGWSRGRCFTPTR